MTVWRRVGYREMKVCALAHCIVARGLAPVGSRSGPRDFATAAQPNGGKPPRHKSRAVINRPALSPI
ncbi:hypothetical protein FQ192_15625 [Pseudomonas sp. ANT_J12]|nr:hypothetical protein FQ192_15625 [Pseudomonas sp. ANT_J12]